MASMGQLEVEEPLSFFSLYETFWSTSLIYPDSVLAIPMVVISVLDDAIQGLFIHIIEEENTKTSEALSSICPLDNWSIVNLFFKF